MLVYDLGIIGAGPAGYTAALHAASKGLKVVVFEKDKIGGVCLNRGCIPTKSVLHSSEIFKTIKKSTDFGFETDIVNFDYSKILERKNSVVEKLRKGLELAFKNAKIEFVNHNAEIIDNTHIKSNGTIFECKKIICAIGASPKVIKGLEFDNEFLLSSDDILNLDKLPKSILVVGSGAIGIEWARIFSAFGVETTVIELAQHLLPIADEEISKRVERIFKSQKIKYYTNTTIEDINNRRITLSNGEVLEPEKVLVGVGRVPNVIEKINGISYIGDCAGEIQLAHYASKQALELIDNIPFRKDLIPSVVYGIPEIAWVGKREQDLAGEDYQKSNVLISSLGKAQCDGETDGIIKILAQNGSIVGAHIISSEASSLIQQLVIAIQNKISVKQLKEVCFAHPTYSEGIYDALFKF